MVLGTRMTFYGARIAFTTMTDHKMRDLTEKNKQKTPCQISQHGVTKLAVMAWP